MMVLENVESIMIRGVYDGRQTTTRYAYNGPRSLLWTTNSHKVCSEISIGEMNFS